MFINKLFVGKMSCHDLVGWQLLHKIIENDIKNEADIIVAITHWFLIKQGGFLCLGLGDQVTETYRYTFLLQIIIF